MPDLSKAEHVECNCHECTQARWKSSLQGQIETAMKANDISREEMAGIQAGLEDVAAGRTKPFTEVQKECRITAAERRVVDAAVAEHEAFQKYLRASAGTASYKASEAHDSAVCETRKAVAALLEERKEEQDVRMDD